MATQITEQTVLSDKAKQHAKDIRTAWTAVGKSTLHYLKTLEKAWIELAEVMNGQQFAKAIGVSSSQLSKHLKIARNPIIMKNIRKLPAAETSLYLLAQIYDDCQKADKNPDRKFQQIIDRASRDKTIEFFIHERAKIKSSARMMKGDKALGLNNQQEKTSEKSHMIPWEKFLASRNAYSTFFINCDSSLLDLVAASENDFSTFFPIADKRIPIQKSQNHCFIYAPTKRIKDAVTLLDCCGFTLQEIYSTSTKPDCLHVIGNQVLIHGVYGGRYMNNVTQANFEPTLEGAIALAESFGDKSRIMFFEINLGRDWDRCSPTMNEIEGV
jgi:hypothetical protein